MKNKYVFTVGLVSLIVIACSLLAAMYATQGTILQNILIAVSVVLTCVPPMCIYYLRDEDV